MTPERQPHDRMVARPRLDPRPAHSIGLTTFTDMFGFFVLLGTGTLLVDRLT